MSYPKAASMHRMRHLQEAFRLAVKDQIEGAKEKHFAKAPIRVCFLSGDLISRETAHSDHGGPKNLPKDLTFSQLMKNFLKEQERVYDLKTQDIVITSQPPYQLEDVDLKERWQNFHAKHAVLHVVSRTANLYLCH